MLEESAEDSAGCFSLHIRIEKRFEIVAGQAVHGICHEVHIEAWGSEVERAVDGWFGIWIAYDIDASKCCEVGSMQQGVKEEMSIADGQPVRR